MIYLAYINGDVLMLSLENLEDSRDLPVTTDFRSLFSNIVEEQFGVNMSSKLFPDWNGKKTDIFK
jgi:uncharacterized protein (DUF1501 family)